ncbi:MAG: hypothetical protein GX318_06830 [Clostridia bacterium]|nr:hypothetical protein [Clostridia bacterium]
MKRGLMFFIALSLLLMGGATGLTAAEPTKGMSYVWTNYSDPNGVSALTKFNDELLVGTNGAGLSVRDNSTLEQKKVYTTENSSLPGNIIEGFYEIDGRLFIVTNGGYCWFDGEEFVPAGNDGTLSYLESAARGNSDIKKHNGAMYFLGYIDEGTQEIVRIDSHLNVSKILPGITVRDFALARDGSLLVLSVDGIYQQIQPDKDEFKKILDLPPEQLQGKTADTALIYDALFYDGDKDSLWYSYREEQTQEIAPLIFAPSFLVEYSQGESQKYEIGNGVWPERVFFRGDKTIFSLKVRRSLDSTSDSLIAINDNTLAEYAPDFNLMDFTGEVDEGFWYYEPGKNGFVLLDENLHIIRDSSIRSQFSKVLGNSLVVFDDQGIYKIDGGKEVFLPMDYLPLERGYEIAEAREGNVLLKGYYEKDWSGELDGTKFSYNKTSADMEKYMFSEPDLTDRNGNKWFRGLQVGRWYCINPQGVEKIYSPDIMKGTPFYDFIAIDEDSKGNIWFLSPEGFTKMTPKGGFSYFMGKDILKDRLQGMPPLFREMEIDNNGDIWVYSDTLGLIKFDAEAGVKDIFSSFGVGVLQTFFIDDFGNKWMVLQGEERLRCVILDKGNSSIEGFLAQGYIEKFENCRYYYDSVGKNHLIALSTFDKEMERFGILRVSAGQNFDFYENELDFARSPNYMFTEIERGEGYLWFTTPAGIVRYDGSDWVTINYQGDGHLNGNCYIENPQRIWVPTTTGIARVEIH